MVPSCFPAVDVAWDCPTIYFTAPLLRNSIMDFTTRTIERSFSQTKIVKQRWWWMSFTNLSTKQLMGVCMVKAIDESSALQAIAYLAAPPLKDCAFVGAVAPMDLPPNEEDRNRWFPPDEARRIREKYEKARNDRCKNN